MSRQPSPAEPPSSPPSPAEPPSSPSHLPPSPSHEPPPAAPPTSPSRTDRSMCTVCLEPIASDVENAYAHSCGSRFHSLCIDRWLRRRTVQRRTCPNCRNLVDKPIVHDSDSDSEDNDDDDDDYEPAAQRIRMTTVRRRLVFSDPSTPPAFHQWIYRPFPVQRRKLAPVIADREKLEELCIPYKRLPVIPSLRVKFPWMAAQFESAISIPVIVELEQLRRVNLSVVLLFDREYEHFVREEENRFNVYAEMFAREYLGRRNRDVVSSQIESASIRESM